MAGNQNLTELLSNFCNAPEWPRYTLPKEFCTWDDKAWLREPAFITIVSIAAVMTVLTLLFITWDFTRSHMADKFIDLSESERMEYMLQVTGGNGRRGEFMRRQAERRAIAAAQLGGCPVGKEAPTS
jgi:hypothetical protein